MFKVVAGRGEVGIDYTCLPRTGQINSSDGSSMKTRPHATTTQAPRSTEGVDYGIIHRVRMQKKILPTGGATRQIPDATLDTLKPLSIMLPWRPFPVNIPSLLLVKGQRTPLRVLNAGDVPATCLPLLVGVGLAATLTFT